MEDINAILSLLKASQPPLSKDEEKNLDLIINAFSSAQKLSVEPEAESKPIENTWLAEPAAVAFRPVALQINFVAQTPNILKVAQIPGATDVYPTIEAAIAASKEDSTILIAQGNYTEKLTIKHKLHFIADGTVELTNSTFQISGTSLSMKDMKISSNDTIFTASKGEMSFQNCAFISSGKQSIFLIKENSFLTFDSCYSSTQLLLNANGSSIIRAIKSHFVGQITSTDSDMEFDTCELSNRAGSAISSNGTVIKIENSTISDCGTTAIVAMNRCLLTFNSVIIRNAKELGIKLQDGSGLRAENISISDCDKEGGILIMNDSTAEISKCSISKCGSYGCKVIYQSTLTLSATWMNANKGIGIISDIRSTLNITRCTLSKSAKIGIQVSNGSSSKINDTLVNQCEDCGIYITSSNLSAASSEFSHNKADGIRLDNRSKADLTNCNLLQNEANGVTTEIDTRLLCNTCFIMENRGAGVSSHGCMDLKLIGSCIAANSLGGLSAEDTKIAVLDRCKIRRNSVLFLSVGNAIVKDSFLISAWTKYGIEPTQHIECKQNTNITFDNNVVMHCVIKVKQTSAIIRLNKISKSPNFAINAEEYSKLSIESNEMSSNNNVLAVKDNCKVVFSNNTVTNITRNKTSTTTTSSLSPGDRKSKALNIKNYSEARIDGNIISGDYDYAIFIDNQSKVYCRGNQIQRGNLGGIMFTGVSSGLCEDNQYSGSFDNKNEEFAYGCTQTRRQVQDLTVDTLFDKQTAKDNGGLST